MSPKRVKLSRFFAITQKMNIVKRCKIKIPRFYALRQGKISKMRMEKL